MLHTETTIVIPDTERSGADRAGAPRVQIAAIRGCGDLGPARAGVGREGADPLVARWVFTGSNNDGQVHRLEMQVRLLDDTGKQIAWFVAKHPLAAGAHDQVFSVPMKVKAEVWKKATAVRIFADWIT